MDKHEFQIKSEQIEKLYRKKEFAAAAKIADTIDWRRTHNVPLLTRVAEIYENVERYEDCYEILNIAYDNSPIGRMIVYKMTEIAVRLKDYDEAVSLYKEFVKIAPHDLGRYELKYEIYKAKGASIEDQIAILEEYKSREYQERWAYELASLYYQQGMYSKCVEECDDLILWFSEGEYVTKAMELKMRIQPLTAPQEEKYRQMVIEGKAEEIEVKPVNTGRFNTANLQEELAEGIKDYLDDTDDKAEEGGDPPRYTTRNTDVNLPDIAAILEKTGKISLPDEFKTDGADKGADGEGKEVPSSGSGEGTSGPQIITGGVDKETARLPRFLGETDTGQLTFDMEENVLDRQITGQLSIEDILKDWEEKKKETEAAIAEAAVREEKKREERKRLRETGQLPNPLAEVQETVPEEIKRLIEEIENRIPVKIHVEPLEGGGKERPEKEGGGQESQDVQTGAPVEADASCQEILEILEAPIEEEKEILDILAAPQEAESSDTPSGGTDTAGQAEDAGTPAEQTKDALVTSEEAEDETALGKEAADEPVSGSEGTGRAPAEEGATDGSAPVEEAVGELTQEVAQTKGGASGDADEDVLPPVFQSLEKSLEETLSSMMPGELSEEQKKLFAYFTSVRGMNQQLGELLSESKAGKPARDNSLTGNIVITGKRGTGKSTLATDIVKALQKQRRVKGSRLLRVTAESLDGKDVSVVVSKLGGGALLVERAGNMKTETAIKLSHAMTRNTGGLVVILEDEKKEIEELFTRCESLGAKFSETIEIPVFTNKELVAFGESYAAENGFVLDEMAMLALYNNIGRKQTSDHLVNVAEVKEMIDEAISRGGKKGLFGKTKKSRLDENGMVVLLEKDFEE